MFEAFCKVVGFTFFSSVHVRFISNKQNDEIVMSQKLQAVPTQKYRRPRTKASTRTRTVLVLVLLMSVLVLRRRTINNKQNRLR